MLVEFPNVKQEGGNHRRRWFQDGAMELIVWYEADDAPVGFQICYRGTDAAEHALTWRAGSGFTHARVDAGDARPDKNLTPILVADGAVPWDLVTEEFRQRSADLAPGLRMAVLEQLRRGPA